MLDRLGNLWELSKYTATTSEALPDRDERVLQQNVYSKPKKKPAIIVETEDLPEMFPEYDETLK